ncbi:methyltransferase domain-containing protein [Burkholderia metallica]|uniref:methyltransferase domain-containing protein n=1 Tax=Burkholderia metallica TaxID=488729 RepID=UPI001CF5E24D|nr:methyltransferase domain-containing protein [Burkholderia metallica]MCA8003503.1 methyltransferase domain-containing protein [Burkholderia metallica]
MTYYRFDDVDQFDSGSCIAYLDYARRMQEVRGIKKRSIELLQIKSGHQVLEVGCGTGDDAYELARLTGSSGRVAAIDSSRAMIEEARYRWGSIAKNTDFEVANVYSLPFHAERFHACRADRVLHLLEFPVAALKEVARVTRFGGRIVVSEPDWSSLSVVGGIIELSRKILEFNAQRASRSASIGSRLAELFADSLVNFEHSLEETIVIRDMKVANPVMNLESVAGRAVAEGVIEQDVAIDWLDALWKASERGEFACSMSGYTAVGVRR